MANKQQKSKKSISRRASNILIAIAAVIIIVPVALLLWVVIDTKKGAGEPVVGSRFDNEISTRITDEQLEEVETVSSMDGVEKAAAVLKSATLRLDIDVVDEMSEEDMSALADALYEEVNAILPVDKYFTNTEKEKMYDLEINVYRFVPNKDSDMSTQIYLVKSKTGAGEVRTDVLTTAKNEEVANELINGIVEEE